jgi:hypothetical protein
VNSTLPPGHCGGRDFDPGRAPRSTRSVPCALGLGGGTPIDLSEGNAGAKSGTVAMNSDCHRPDSPDVSAFGGRSAACSSPVLGLIETAGIPVIRLFANCTKDLDPYIEGLVGVLAELLKEGCPAAPVAVPAASQPTCFLAATERPM